MAANNFQVGVYKWSYEGGDFLVSFRPHGVFHCAKYPAQATWHVVPQGVVVDWKKFGVYEFPFGANPLAFEGHARGNPSNWRKLELARDFSPIEKMLLGNGFGSVWDFAWEKGSFEVEFRCDGYNHFVCKQYPAHSHWDIDESGLLYVNWGKYGEYELRLDQSTNQLVGYGKGQPANWRRATLIRALGQDTMIDPSMDHSHDHVHTDSCKH